MGNKTKLIIASLLLAVALLSCALAYSLWLYTLQNQMGITAYKEVQVEYPLGTKITAFDWGNFNKSYPVKSEVFYLRSLSNVALNCTWNVTGLDSAFAFDLNVTRFEFMGYDQVIPFAANLTLVDFGKAPGSFAFDLLFGEE
jgi:hypothetical protein